MFCVGGDTLASHGNASPASSGDCGSSAAGVSGWAGRRSHTRRSTGYECWQPREAVAQMGAQTGASIDRGTTVLDDACGAAAVGRALDRGPQSGASVPPLQAHRFWPIYATASRESESPRVEANTGT